MTTLALSPNVPVARRQLLARRGRTVAGVVGIAVALLLVLALKAIFAGLESRMTAYIDHSGADVVVAQQGVATMHMTQSALPAGVVAAVARVPGVAAAGGILYKSAFVEAGGKSGIVALVGGGPVPNLVSGSRPGAGEIVLDSALADQLAVARGDRVRALGAQLRVAGEVSGTAAINGSYAFVTRRTFERMLHAHGVVSYVLVRARSDVAADTLAKRIEARLPRVTASTRSAFAASERRVVGDMSTDIVRGMILVGFIVGVAVAGLVAYSATLAQLRDLGVLRALGLRARGALALVLAQIATMVAAAFLLALVLVELLAVALPALSPTLALSVRTGDVVQAALVAGAVTVGAAIVPLLRVVRVEPASVFRRTG
ncbi:MAG TPA: ABC transporter permease [Gaiellaceae bacterium]|nr:ABC transporter permease [Gaiellaceae bacterium]